MSEGASSKGLEGGATSKRLPLLLAMAMFVLVVDTSIMNVSITAVAADLDTSVSSVQSAIALEALVSAAFILISSKLGDLIGRKRAYVLGLLGYAIGALAMTLAQSMTAVVIFWAIIGGLGASLLLPAMQSLIHGNFEGAAMKKTYALVGASAAVGAAIGPLIGGFVTTYLSWRVGFLMEVVIIAIVLANIKLVRDVAYTGLRKIDTVGAALSIVGHGRHRARHPGLAGRRRVRPADHGGRRRRARLRSPTGSSGASVRARWRCSIRTCSRSRTSGSASRQMVLQQITLGGAMIALPLYLQVTLEYNAMQAGLSMAPLSLTMFAVALLAGKKAGNRRPASIIRLGFGLALVGMVLIIPVIPRGESGLGAAGAAPDRRNGPRPPGLAAQQLHPGSDRGGAGQRGGRGQLRRPVLRAVVRTGDRGRHPPGGPVAELRQHDRGERRDPAGGSGADRRPCWRTTPSS